MAANEEAAAVSETFAPGESGTTAVGAAVAATPTIAGPTPAADAPALSKAPGKKKCTPQRTSGVKFATGLSVGEQFARLAIGALRNLAARLGTTTPDRQRDRHS